MIHHCAPDRVDVTLARDHIKVISEVHPTDKLHRPAHVGLGDHERRDAEKGTGFVARREEQQRLVGTEHVPPRFRPFRRLERKGRHSVRKQRGPCVAQ